MRLHGFLSPAATSGGIVMIVTGTVCMPGSHQRAGTATNQITAGQRIRTMCNGTSVRIARNAIPQTVGVEQRSITTRQTSRLQEGMQRHNVRYATLMAITSSCTRIAISATRRSTRNRRIPTMLPETSTMTVLPAIQPLSGGRQRFPITIHSSRSPERIRQPRAINVM